MHFFIIKAIIIDPTGLALHMLVSEALSIKKGGRLQVVEKILMMVGTPPPNSKRTCM